MKFGSSDGNSGAIIRWGKKLDNGIWIRRWRFHRLWTKWRFSQRYVNFGIILFHWDKIFSGYEKESKERR
jgi:hypothetical protein